jgi:ABC-2 type transport system permease protein
MIAILLKPKYFSLKNRWRKTAHRKALLGRDFVIFVFSTAVMLGIYHGTSTALDTITKNAHLVYLPPSMPFGLILLMLSVMLLFSSAVSAIGTLFLGKDLDLILASPISPFRFFYGKLLEVVFSSSWMSVVFGIPVILAFGQAYHAPAYYYCFALITLLPFFVIPSSLAIAVVTLITILIPAKRAKPILVALTVASVTGIYYMATTLDPGQAGYQDMNDVLRVVAILTLPNTTWMPSFWAATAIGTVLDGSARTTLPYVLMLYSTALSSVALSYIIVRLCHHTAYSMAKGNQSGPKIESRLSRKFLLAATPFLHPQFRAIMDKEVKGFARDITQAMQLILLLALCVIYLYNFRMLQAVQGLPPDARIWWQGFLVVSNIAMGAFVITAACTRFVFPSVSMEGQSYWILQSAPVEISDILRAKFWCWLIPIATMSSVVFSTGAMAINAERHIVWINGMASWVICYGIVGLAIGLGAYFANFDWEHTSQLAASFGSLIFMLVSTMVICLNMLPVALLIFLRTLKNSGYPISEPQWYLYVGSTALLLVYINYATTRWGLRVGEKALRDRLK